MITEKQCWNYHLRLLSSETQHDVRPLTTEALRLPQPNTTLRWLKNRDYRITGDTAWRATTEA
jgi:hypothetical protein